MSIVESIRIVPKGDVALVEWDLVGEKVNKLSPEVMARFKEVIEELKTSSYKAAVLISRKKGIFIAGADIDKIKSYTTKAEFRTAIESAHEILNAFEDLPIPTVAAIHGACLGGGCELVLACDYRIASDSKGTRIGLPETKLGIIPGFGGCWRLPRCVGIQASLNIIIKGGSVDSRKAKKIGLVDEQIPEAIFEQRALAFANEVIKKGKRTRVHRPKNLQDKFVESFVGKPVAFNKARKDTLKATKGFYPAQEKAIEVVKSIYGMKDRTQALAIETEGFCEVAITDVSKHLIDLFYMMEAVKKQNGTDNPDEKGHDVDYLALLGAGTMGGGIAYVAADKGIEVRLKDISNDALALGFQAARKLWEKKLKRRRIDKFEFSQKMNLVSGGLDWSGFHQADVVVEAIVEDMKIKKAVIAEMANHLKEDCIVATNTSSLSVNEMAEAYPRPENFVGMHFFNPVPMMPLVEVIRGEKSSDKAVATIFNLSKKMGKTPVVVKDGPGFLVNRLLLPYMGECMFLLEEGMAIDVVDRYYTHKFGMPMGPFRLLDEVGHDVGLKVLKIFQESLGDRIQMAEVAGKMKDSGRLGKKNGKGFYSYDERGKETGVDESVYGDLGLGTPTNPLGEKECLERGLFQMINEASATLLTDKIVGSPQEVDLAMIFGTGFPPFRGGLLKYADSIGAEYVVQELEVYAERYGRRFQPLPAMVNLAKGNRKFYDNQGGLTRKAEDNSSHATL